MSTVQYDEHQIKFEADEDVVQTDDTTELSEDQHEQLIQFLQHRLTLGAKKRSDRISRMGRVDQMISTWQKLTPEDSVRTMREETNGRLQAIPVNLPIAAAHIDDTVSFFSEVFAPIGGNFYATPGARKLSDPMKKLVDKMNQDSKYSKYYKNVTAAMRSLCKYNIGGLTVTWVDGDQNGIGEEQQSGNHLKSIDMYNVMWDPTILKPEDIAKEGEWFATFRQVNRLWLMRKASQGLLINLDKVFNPPGNPKENYSEGNKVKYFKNPPATTNMNEDGSDSKTSANGQQEVDWDEFFGSLGSEAVTTIIGHELTTMYCWINPSQFKLSDERLQLWRFLIVDGTTIVAAQELEASEIPAYLTFLNQDDMGDAARAIAEHIRPFQRVISFLVNTHIEGIRKSVWGLKGVDPTMFDTSTIANGETSGLLVSKQPGRDVRTGLIALDGSPGTEQNLQGAGLFMDLMKQFFPSQSIPSQVGGIDRAINSQVTAIMQGAMRKLHMLVRLMDSDLMMPIRMAQYRNIASSDPDAASLKGIKEEEVADLLASGLGQVGREAAAEQVRTLIFALIQNPEGAAGYDIPGLFTIWSALLNIGFDLSEFVKGQAVPAGTQVIPAGGVAETPGADPSAATIPGQAMSGSQPPIPLPS